MPSLQYTQTKGLIHVNSSDETLDLQGQLYGYKQKVESLSSASHQLSLADSGKELLLAKTDGQTVLLPAVAGVKTDLKLTAQRAFTVGTTIDFSAFGRTFKLQVVAQGGAVASGKRIDSNGVASATGDRFALEAGGGAAAAGTNLRDLLANGAEDFAALSGVTVSAMDGAAFTIIANAEGASNNGTVAISEAADLVLTDAPDNGQDTIASAAGAKIRLVVSVALGTDVLVKIPTDRLDDAASGDTQGSFVGTVLRTGGSVGASNDTMTIAAAQDNLGDFYEFICDGDTTTPKWYVSGVGQAGAAVVSFA